jgi:AbrB family looped-hinge helix DNA binding protein
MEIETATLSSKGQLVIPELMRKQLKLRKGSKLRLVSVGGDLIVSPIRPPTIAEFEELVKAGGPWAEQTPEEEEMVNRFIHEERAKDRAARRH